jgi:hypothetical protein
MEPAQLTDARTGHGDFNAEAELLAVGLCPVFWESQQNQDSCHSPGRKNRPTKDRPNIGRARQSVCGLQAPGFPLWGPKRRPAGSLNGPFASGSTLPLAQGGLLEPRAEPPSYARVVLGCFCKVAVLAGFAAKAQPPMVMADET